MPGCAYGNPSCRRGTDADDWLWVHQGELAGGLEDRPTRAVKQSTAEERRFRNAAHPRRGNSWEDDLKLLLEMR